MHQTTVDLESPFKVGETEITQLTVRKPVAGELRGLSLPNLVNGDVDSFIKLLPRITTPIISELELTSGVIDVIDFTALMNEVITFLLPRSFRDYLPKL